MPTTKAPNTRSAVQLHARSGLVHRARVGSAAGILAVMGLAGTAAQAQTTSTWTGNQDSSWVNPFNWTVGIPGINPSDTARFVSTATTLTVDVNIPIVLDRLWFDDTEGNGYTLSGQPITLFGGGIEALSVGQTHTINNDIVLSADSAWGSWGVTTLEINGTVSENGGSFGFEANGSAAASILFNAPTTFTGDVTLTSGVLRIADPFVFQSNTVVLNGGDFDVITEDINAHIGALGGSGALNIGSTKFTTGLSGANSTYSGVITGTVDGVFSHDGSGRLTLTGSGHSLRKFEALDGHLRFDGGTVNNMILSPASSFVGKGGDVTVRNGALVSLPPEATISSLGGRGFFVDGSTLTVTGSGTRFEAGRLDFSVSANDSSTLIVRNNAVVDITLGSDPLLLLSLSNDASVASTETIISSGGSLLALQIVAGATLNDTADILVTGPGSSLTAVRMRMGGQGQANLELATATLIITDEASADFGQLDILSTASSVTVNGGSLVVGRLLSFGLTPGFSISDPASGPALTIGSDAINTTLDTGIADSAGGPGSLTKVGSGTLTLNAQSTYSGDTIVEGGTLVLASSSGSATGIGAVILKNNSTLIAAGIISGDLTIDSTGGTVTSPSSGITTLSVDALVCSPAATLIMELGPAGSDQISASSASLNGTLDLLYVNGAFTALPGDEFVVIDAGSIGGQFQTVNYPDAQDWDIKYISGQAIVFIAIPPCGPADLNGDGALDVFDVFEFLADYDNGACTGPSGDFNGDGVCDVFDVFAFLAAYDNGNGCP